MESSKFSNYKAQIPVRLQTPMFKRKSRYSVFTILSVYVPTIQSSNVVKEEFYDSLEWKVQSTPKDDLLLIQGL